MTTIAFASCLMTSPGLIRCAWAQADERAVAFIKGTSDQLVAIANDEGSQQQKRHRLREVIDASVDVDDIAHFCLGRFWRIATPDQQADYLALFHDLLVTKIASHLGDYQGVRVIMGQARASGDTEIVITKVVRPENPVIQVEWVISIATGSPRIVDLLAEGTSLRLTQRADFASYLTHHQYNVQDLIDGMRHLVALNGS
ncbi:MlaC/ttg2D family ABC transporter substrate-binding protein [Telmatospirillum siberiense]|nr:ABC transporter substrate-binding protein [Telmatospirillum siberiense]